MDLKPQRRDLIDDTLYPIRTIEEDREVHDAAKATQLREEADINDEHAQELRKDTRDLRKRDFGEADYFESVIILPPSIALADYFFQGSRFRRGLLHSDADHFNSRLELQSFLLLLTQVLRR